LNRQGTLVKRLGVAVAALLIIKRSQIVDCLGDIDMFGTQRVLVDSQSAFPVAP
jgi:hypothetical protein